MAKNNINLNYKYIDFNDLITKATSILGKEGLSISEDMVEYVFRFQFDEIHRQMKNKEYITIPNLGTFGIQIWKDILEDERVLFCVKNRKGDFVKGTYKLNNTVINHNWLYYNQARSEHTSFNDAGIYRKEIDELFNKYKEFIITRELLIDAYKEENKLSKDKIEYLLNSTKDQADKWYINKVDRKRKIDYHNIEGFVSYRDKKIEENRLL